MLVLILSPVGRRQKRRCRWFLWIANRLLSNIQSPNRATPLATITPFTPWRRVTPTLPVSRQCTRPWPDLCCTGPLKDSTLVCSLMVKQDLENHTREWLLCFCFFICFFYSYLLLCIILIIWKSYFAEWWALEKSQGSYLGSVVNFFLEWPPLKIMR